MKKVCFILAFCALIPVFYSCNSNVDLYAEYKDVPIIYAMLNPLADTNYVKITRAFCGSSDNPIDATEVALISDSSNYPGKLDARVVELKSNWGGHYEPTGRVFVLDTITIHNKEEGVFYAPDQMVYYTPDPLNAGTEEIRYKYRLVVVKPDGDTLTAITNMVGNREFSIITSGVSFQKESTDAVGRIMFRADGSAPLYEIEMQFNYWEQLAGQGIKHKNISRSFGTKAIDDYQIISENSYCLEYSLNWLFNSLRNAIGGDTIVNPNHPNVVRYIDDFVITISAAGEDLYYYFLANQAQENNPGGFFSAYSNIDGGYGLFSSRSKIEKEVKLSSNTKRDLFSITSWGFKEE